MKALCTGIFPFPSSYPHTCKSTSWDHFPMTDLHLNSCLQVCSLEIQHSYFLLCCLRIMTSLPQLLPSPQDDQFPWCRAYLFSCCCQSVICHCSEISTEIKSKYLEIFIAIFHCQIIQVHDQWDHLVNRYGVFWGWSDSCDESCVAWAAH